MNEIQDNPVEELLNGIDEEAASQDDRFEIPMDAPIEEFKYHLKSHPRTILSAKFGDGKSFFLSKFEEVMKDDCLILTLHPVNYQVIENKDVFELIKRDILFQIMANKMLDENLEISDLTAWVFYIQNDFMGVAESLTSFIPLLQPSPKVVAGVLAALKGLKVFQDLREKVMKIKKKYKSKDVLESFLNECEDISVLEEDLVTKIIQDSIDDYNEKFPNKRIVLVIEDMDRLDPAHLFRIMNVFSAHLDTNEREYKKAESFRLSNKFHFDNVVFVMDFDNTKNIFKHFYGTDTDFEGYIEKFVTKGVFNYSLKVEKYNYFIDRVTSITELPKEYVQDVLKPECFERRTIRAIVSSFENVEDHIIRYPFYDKKRLHFGILKLYAIMKNLAIDGNELVNSVKSIFTENNYCWPLGSTDKTPVLSYFINVLYDFHNQSIKFILSALIKEGNVFFKDYIPTFMIHVNGFDDKSGCLSYTIDKLDNIDVDEYKDYKDTVLHRFTEIDVKMIPEILDNYVA